MLDMTISEMSCGGCAKAITRIIHTVQSDADVKIDVASKHVEVSNAQDAQAILAALAEGGYPADNH